MPYKEDLGKDLTETHFKLSNQLRDFSERFRDILSCYETYKTSDVSMEEFATILPRDTGEVHISRLDYPLSGNIGGITSPISLAPPCFCPVYLLDQRKAEWPHIRWIWITQDRITDFRRPVVFARMCGNRFGRIVVHEQPGESRR